MYLGIPFGVCFFLLCVWCTVQPFLEKDQAGLRRPLNRTSYLIIYLGSVGTFLSSLFLYHKVTGFLCCTPRQLSLTDDYLYADPPVVDKLAALEYDTPCTLREKLKVCFFLCTGILPLRALTAITSLLLAMGCVRAIGRKSRHNHQLWYQFWSTAATSFGLLTLASVSVYDVKIFGANISPTSECKFLIGNHCCIMEAMILFILGDMPSFVSRTENQKVWLFGGIVKACDAILVDREAAASRTQTLEAIKRRAADPKASRLMIFPEGTTGNQRALFQFKKGIFEAAEPVQMVCTAFPYRYFNPCWTSKSTGGISLFEIFIRLCSQFVTYAEVRILPVYYPTAEEKEDPVRYALRSQKAMAAVLGVNVSEATFRDYKAAEDAYLLRGAKKHD